ncbi:MULTISPECIES: glycosyltransferase family 2 protein [unclassified Adlercreutzia]|uniref:glycosyltransferase family 2 protein n=1 Tax=unclassified Adlercreutzia TaxID=2636013 RepID=UPI0013EDED8A|nr:MULTISPECIES: glycosyltransferase family 2 protein [unclassified Adlercreutzia]
MSSPLLWIVIPCFNEEKVLPLTAPLFFDELEKLVLSGRVDSQSKICFVDDGSHDSTWQIISALSMERAPCEGMSLARNRGHQNAVLAGMMEARGKCDICITVDCDGQDDIATIGRMVDAFLDGSDVVYGVRSSRRTDTAFKRISAESFYRVMKSMGADVVFNHADFRLMSARALDGLAQFGEVNLFLRGLVPLVGFPSSTVEYERSERYAGESHYPLSKMLSLAFDGITSLSIKPVHLIASCGAALSLLGFLGVLWALFTALFGLSVSGWASITCLICFFGGLQLLALGVIGEYVGKVYLETKARPRFIVQERTWVSSGK